MYNYAQGLYDKSKMNIPVVKKSTAERLKEIRDRQGSEDIAQLKVAISKLEAAIKEKDEVIINQLKILAEKESFIVQLKIKISKLEISAFSALDLLKVCNDFLKANKIKANLYADRSVMTQFLNVLHMYVKGDEPVDEIAT